MNRTYTHQHLFYKGSFVKFLILLACLLSTLYSVNAQTATIQNQFSCPADIVKNNDPGQCGAVVNFDATADTGVTVVYSRSSGTLFPVGTTNVKATAYDANWNPLSTCSFNVTVLNKKPLFFSPVQNITITAGHDSADRVVNYATPVASVLCPFQSRTFTYTGNSQIFVVPPGVTSLNVEVSGAAGGHASSYDGYAYGYPGFGGMVEATIPVTPGQSLIITVGGAGQDATATTSGAGGFNGGASGGSYENTYLGGGGGGASDIRNAPGTLAQRLVVAGAGGASGWYGAGGNGGYLEGGAGYGDGTPAGGGTQTAGGVGGTYYDYFFAGSGSVGFGGSGADGTQGGGGGGGYYGGGGGAFGDGGGGSSYTYADATNVIHTQGSREGDGLVRFKWYQPAVVTQTAGLPSGSVFGVGTTVNTFKATDAAGNTAETSFTVSVAGIVTDTTQPAAKSVVTESVNTTNVTGTSVAATINGNIPDVWAVSSGGTANTIYLGYGPDRLTLNVVLNSGTAPYTYGWTKTGSTATISTSSKATIHAEGEYTVTVKDVNGVTANFTRYIRVVDLRCGTENDKIAICHVAENGKDKAKAKCVAKDAAAKFLQNGYQLGTCTISKAEKAKQAEVILTGDEDNDLKVYPNPTSGKFKLRLDNFKASKAEIIVVDASGTIIEKQTIELTTDGQIVNFNLSKNAPGLYVIKVITNTAVQTTKVLLQP